MIDEELVQRIVRLVLQRLGEMSATGTNETATCEDHVVSARHLEESPIGSQLIIHENALVTPLAKDTAKDRNIQIVRSSP